MYIRGRKRFAPIYMKDGDGEGEGGGSGGGGDTFTAEQVQEKVDEAVLGLKSKNADLINDVKTTKAALKPWEGLDADNVRNMLDKFENDEELKLIAEGKHTEAWDRKLEKVTATHQSQVDGITTERDTYKTELDAAKAQVRDLIIDQQVISSFMTEKGLETAAPDVVNRAKAAFVIEDGVAIARDDAGQIIRGEDGPITVKEWVAGLKTTAPHLFPGSQGAGAGGSQGGGGSDVRSLMEAAASRNDMKEYRRLRTELDKKAG